MGPHAKTGLTCTTPTGAGARNLHKLTRCWLMNCMAGSGHVQALVKRGVGPVRDPKHRSQERVRSARRSGQSAVSPDKVGATSTDTKSTDFEYTIHHHPRRCSTGTSRSTPGSCSEASAIMSFFIMSLILHHQSLSRFVACSVAVVRWCGFGGPG